MTRFLYLSTRQRALALAEPLSACLPLLRVLPHFPLLPWGLLRVVKHLETPMADCWKGLGRRDVESPE